MTTLSVLGLLVAMAAAAAAQCKPSLRGCGALSPTLNQCLARNIMYDIVQLKNGVKEFGIPSLDPLKVADIRVTAQGKTLDLQSCVLTGGVESKMSDVTFGATGPTVGYTLTVPNFALKCAKYTSSEGFLGAPKSSGSFTLTAKNYKGSYLVKSATVQQCGNLYQDVNKATITSKYIGSDTFQPNFSNAKFNLKTLEPYLIAALTKAQGDENLKYLKEIYAYFPPINQYVLPTAEENKPYCLKKRCSYTARKYFRNTGSRIGLSR